MTTERAPRGPYAKTAARQAEIIEAALHVFATYGFHGASLRSIAERAGITHAGILHHFKRKEDLLAAVLERRDQLARDRLGQTPAESLRAGLVELATLNAGYPELVRLFVTVSAEATSAEHPAHDFFLRRYAQLRSELAEGLRREQDAGRLDPGLDVDAAAVSIGALMDGLQLQWLLDPSIDMAAVLDAALAVLLPPAPAAGSTPA